MINNDLQQMLKPLVNRLGYELWGCEYLPQGMHSLLRIYIDKEDGIGIEDCETVSRQVSTLLDVEDPISGNYSLEVSSPGIPRPLFYPWQYARYIGEQARLKLFKPIDNSRKLTATIVAVNDENVVFGVDDREFEIPITQIVKANLTGE